MKSVQNLHARVGQPKKGDHKILIILLGLVGDEDLKLGRPKNLGDPKPNILNVVVSFPCPCTVDILIENSLVSELPYLMLSSRSTTIQMSHKMVCQLKNVTNR